MGVAPEAVAMVVGVVMAVSRIVTLLVGRLEGHSGDPRFPLVRRAHLAFPSLNVVDAVVFGVGTYVLMLDPLLDLDAAWARDASAVGACVLLGSWAIVRVPWEATATAGRPTLGPLADGGEAA